MNTSDPSVPSCLRSIRTIFLRELRDALASRWFIFYSVAFAGLGLAVSYVSASSLGGSGMAGFGRTSAGLINLVLLIVPLMALTAGAGSVSGDCERGTLAYLLTQPVRRWEVLLGKYLGLASAIVASLCLGFGLSMIGLALTADQSDAAPLLLLVALSTLLALAMLSVGMLISISTRRTSVAVGVAVFAWLVLVFATDFGLMGGILAGKLSIHGLFAAAIISPLQVFKMWSLQSVDATLDVLGPTGLYAQTVHGSNLHLIFGAVMSAWIVGPMVVAAIVLSRRVPL
jgi:Cu-processing system permease protein